MEVNVESTGALTRQLRVEIPAEEFEQEYQRRIRQVASRARIPGFRPGKAPLTVIQRQFGADARADAISELMRRSFPDAISKAGISPAGTPRFELKSEPPSSPLTYIAYFDVLPEITLQGLDSLRVQSPRVEISEADIDRLIESLRKARRKWTLADRPAAIGDQCRIDFIGKVNGEPFDGGKGEDVPVELGAGQFLPDLEAAIVGHQTNDTFVANVRFPDDYQNEQLRGKTAEFEISVRGVSAAELPEIDGAFLKAHGVEASAGEAGLRAKCRNALESERDKAVQNHLKTELLAQLEKANPIDLPPSRIQQEIGRLRADMVSRSGLEKMGRKMEPEQLMQILPDTMFEEQARRRVALGLLISELVRKHDIKASEERIKVIMERLANEYENPGELIRYYRSNVEAMNDLRNLALEEEVVDFLLGQSEQIEVAMSLGELLQSTKRPTT